MNNFFSYPKLKTLTNLKVDDLELYLDKTNHTWLENLLEEKLNDEVKEIKPYRIRPWSQIFTIETNKNKSYFLKIPAKEFSQESKINMLIDSFNMNLTIKVIAFNEVSGAFLMPKLNGETLRKKLRKQFSETILINEVGKIATFQKYSRDYISEFKELKIPEWTSKKIIQNIEKIIDNPRFLSKTQLSDNQVKKTKKLLNDIYKKLNLLVYLDKGLSIDHGDFQDNNLFVSNKDVYLMDWADCNISIPSFTIATYCHSVLLAHPNISNKSILIRDILENYYNNLLGCEYDKINKNHIHLVHYLYPVVCILKVGRLLRLKNNDIDKYICTIIDYWAHIILSFSQFYSDESLSD